MYTAYKSEDLVLRFPTIDKISDYHRYLTCELLKKEWDADTGEAWVKTTYENTDAMLDAEKYLADVLNFILADIDHAIDLDRVIDFNTECDGAYDAELTIVWKGRVSKFVYSPALADTIEVIKQNMVSDSLGNY